MNTADTQHRTITDDLRKPDMRAVLERTHLSLNLNDFLLPVFEAISNAMHGIESKYEDTAASAGTVQVRFTNPVDPANLSITVSDNGVGLDDENYLSFKTPFSGHKLKAHGRGFGRFISFKVFGRAVYWSRYEFFANSQTRSFRFDVNSDHEFALLKDEPAFAGTGVMVAFDQPLTQWHAIIRELKVDDVADAIASHFLPYFLYRWLPDITIEFGDADPINIKSRFGKLFVQMESGEIKCEIDGQEETLSYSLSRVGKTRQFKSHCLLFAAADRIVGSPRDLTNKLGNPHFFDEEGKPYIVLAVVRSTAFESRLNDARTGLNLPVAAVERIVSAISDVVQAKEASQIARIKREQSVNLAAALRENPILRLGLRGKTVGEYVSGKPNNWAAEQFIGDLAIERHRATVDLSKAIADAASNPENYAKSLQDLVQKLDATKKEALAEYVLHRKSIIELVEGARRLQEGGKRTPEDVIHDLIFRRFSDSTQLDYFQHNLWLIDDALAFLPYVNSDRSLHGKGRKAGDKVADLGFFDDSMVLGDNDGTTITIVEFKKPSRNDFKFGNVKDDPVLQVVNTLDQATQRGAVERADGTHYAFRKVVRRFGFIIADLTSSLETVLKLHQFRNDWNPDIYVSYRQNEDIFIQAFGYDTLVENAKKRNTAFFSVLLGE